MIEEYEEELGQELEAFEEEAFEEGFDEFEIQEMEEELSEGAEEALNASPYEAEEAYQILDALEHEEVTLDEAEVMFSEMGWFKKLWKGVKRGVKKGVNAIKGGIRTVKGTIRTVKGVAGRAIRFGKKVANIVRRGHRTYRRVRGFLPFEDEEEAGFVGQSTKLSAKSTVSRRLWPQFGRCRPGYRRVCACVPQWVMPRVRPTLKHKVNLQK